MAGVPLDGSLIDHDGESKSRMALGRRHHQLGCLVDGIAGAIPVNDRTVDAAADHVVDLTLYLRRVRLTVADVHVVRPAEPKNHVSVNLGRGARIKQSVNVNFAYISGASIVIRLRSKAVCRARVVCGLSGESGGWHHIRIAGRT